MVTDLVNPFFLCGGRQIASNRHNTFSTARRNHFGRRFFQLNFEPRSPVGTVAVGGNGSVVEFHQEFAEGEADAQTALRAVKRAIDLRE